MTRLFGTPALFFNEDRRLELFVVGFDDALYQIWQQVPNGAWSGINAGSANYQPPGLIGSLDQRLEVFVGGGDLTHKWQVAINNGWSAWVNSGSPPAINPPLDPAIGAPTTALCRRDDCLYVFATDESARSGLWYIHQPVPNDDGFSGWISLGNPTTTTIVGPSGVAYNDGLIQVFAVGGDNALWGIQQVQVQQPRRHLEWSGWSSYGIAGNGFSDRPDIGFSDDGRNELFVVGRDGSLYHIWQTVFLGGWSAWYSHGNPGTGLNDHPVTAYPDDARSMVFASGLDGAVHYLRQVARNNGWSGWMSLGVPGGGAEYAAVSGQENNLLQLFVTARDGSLWNIRQTDVNNWSGWSSFGQP